MKIQMSKRKPGIYSNWYVVYGLDEKNKECFFIINHNQAKNYAQAIRFWNKIWGAKNKAFSIRNSEPYDTWLSLAC